VGAVGCRVLSCELNGANPFDYLTELQKQYLFTGPAPNRVKYCSGDDARV
jgi:hypothetical protein